MNNDLTIYFRRIKFCSHFGLSSKDELTEEQLFGKRNSNWTPNSIDHTVETFTAEVKHDTDTSTARPLPKDNLTQKERKALFNPQRRDDIIITKADKSGATVIIDVNDYITEVERQLKNTEFYKELRVSPIEEHKGTVNDTIETFRRDHSRSPTKSPKV